MAGAKRVVIHVEDEPDIAEIVGMLFAGEGWEAHHGTNVLEDIQIIDKVARQRRAAADEIGTKVLILLDLNMPAVKQEHLEGITSLHPYMFDDPFLRPIIDRDASGGFDRAAIAAHHAIHALRGQATFLVLSANANTYRKDPGRIFQNPSATDIDVMGKPFELDALLGRAATLIGHVALDGPTIEGQDNQTN